MMFLTRNKINDFFSKISIKKILILNLIYILLLIFFSGNNISFNGEKNFMVIVNLDLTFFTGKDVLYEFRIIRVAVKILSFSIIGLLSLIFLSKLPNINKYTPLKKKNILVIYFIFNLITLILIQILLLDLIIINIYNYILYAVGFSITVAILKNKLAIRK